MKYLRKLTIIELAVIVVLLGFLSTIFLYQFENIRASQRDDDRKTAINAMHHNLESVYYKKRSYYPYSINTEVLKAVDPALFIDPEGREMNDPHSDYRYEGIDCIENRCQAYRLSARLEKEANYIKVNRN